MAQKRLLDQLTKVPQTIARDSEFVGDLSGSENYIVHGKATGNCDVEGTVMFGPNCHWKGNVIADIIVVRGAVEGNVTARTKLEVRTSARIRGNVSGPIVAIAEGAQLEGRISPESCVTRFVERRA